MLIGGFMAKRFTDSQKWKKTYFKGLSTVNKLFFLYILDDCDHAGIWNVEIDVAQLRIGEKLDIDSIKSQLGKHLFIFDEGSKWFLPGFIAFQYGVLNEGVNAHKSVINILKSFDLFFVYEQFINSLSTDQDKDQYKDIKKKSTSIIVEILDDLNKLLGTNYKTSSIKTKTLINARLKEGFSVEDFKTVHRKKIAEWEKNPDMAKYLRPETLYGNKFESYLNQKAEIKPQGVKKNPFYEKYFGDEKTA